MALTELEITEAVQAIALIIGRIPKDQRANSLKRVANVLKQQGNNLSARGFETAAFILEYPAFSPLFRFSHSVPEAKVLIDN